MEDKFYKISFTPVLYALLLWIYFLILMIACITLANYDVGQYKYLAVYVVKLAEPLLIITLIPPIAWIIDLTITIVKEFKKKAKGVKDGRV